MSIHSGTLARISLSICGMTSEGLIAETFELLREICKDRLRNVDLLDGKNAPLTRKFMVSVTFFNEKSKSLLRRRFYYKTIN